MKLLISKYHNSKDIYCLGRYSTASDFDKSYDKCSCKLVKRTEPPNCLLIDEYSKFKFVLTMENGFRKGYVTEKIINAFVAGSIPIYWGITNMQNNYLTRNHLFVFRITKVLKIV